VLAVVQAVAVEVEGQAPAFDIDLQLAGFGRFVDAPQWANVQGGVSQELADFAGGQGRHWVTLCK
jgi:hypothetical protein